MSAALQEAAPTPRHPSPDPRQNAGRYPSTPLGERMREVMSALQRASHAVWSGSFDADGGDHEAAARLLAEGWAHVERVRAEADALAIALALPHGGEAAHA
ncbi:hypothetical protein tb265_38820 [Gemmatimonadetes bacterium T265]|nr:hypothetical protein tb265_38820 [Gemmatimonadetes bacterium T265]